MKAKDNRDTDKARNAILRLFPQIPLASCQAVLDHGFQKGSGRVGRSSVLDDDEKVTLAIVAHVRHTMTPYDTLLRELDRNGVKENNRRETARAMIRGRVEDVLSQWRSSSPNAVLKPMNEKPKAKPVRGKNLKVRALRKVSRGITGATNAAAVKGKKQAVGPSLEASIHAVRSKSENIQKRNPPRRASTTRREDGTVPQETTTFVVQTNPRDSTRTKGSPRGFSAAHMTNSLEASIHAMGSFTKSLLDTNEVSTTTFRATHMTGSDFLEASVHAINYTIKDTPTTSGVSTIIGTGLGASTEKVLQASLKKRSREIEEGTPRVKRTKCEDATVGVPVDIQDCYAPAIAGSPATSLEYADDEDNLPLVLNAMHLEGTSGGSQSTVSVARPFLHPTFSSTKASILKENSRPRLKHPTRRQLFEMKNGALPLKNKPS